LTAGLIYVLAPKGSGDTITAEAWDGDAQQAFSDLVGRVPTLVNAARGWMAGEKGDAEFGAEVGMSKLDFENSRRRVRELKTPKQFREAHNLYVASSDLYLATANVYEAAVRKPAGDVRVQLDLLARRLRELADRVFDRGRTELGLKRGPTPNVDVKDPEEVPIWTAEGLAAGPPLDDPPPARADTPPLRAATRPEQSRARWERDVRAARAPSDATLAKAIDRGDADELREVARRFVAAAEYLRDKPDPRDGREESARLRLAWLVAADAARAAQAGVAQPLVVSAAAMIRP
jgi:hypothetical protein